MFEVAERRVSESMIGIRDALQDTLDNLEARYGQDSDLVGVPTGFTEVDSILYGLQRVHPHDPRGPSRDGQDVPRARYGAQRRHPDRHGRSIFFSMEMGTLELTKRLLAMEARVDASKLWTAKLSEGDWSRLSHAVGRLAEAQLYIDDNPHCTVMEMRAKARRMRARFGDLALIVVDYVQLMTPSTTRARREPSGRGLGDLAWPEDPRPRARLPGRGALTAQPPGRVPPGQAPDARRPP